MGTKTSDAYDTGRMVSELLPWAEEWAKKLAATRDTAAVPLWMTAKGTLVEAIIKGMEAERARHYETVNEIAANAVEGASVVIDHTLKAMALEIRKGKFESKADLQLAKCTQENERLSGELKEVEALLELQRSRVGAAQDAWRAAHPGNENVIPDLGALVTWLMQKAGLSK